MQLNAKRAVQKRGGQTTTATSDESENAKKKPSKGSASTLNCYKLFGKHTILLLQF